MIYRGDTPHPAHRGFAEAIKADLLSLDRISLQLETLRHSIPEEVLNGALLPNYDIYIVEGTRAMYGAIMSQFISDSILIYLAGDQALYKLQNPSYKHASTLNTLIARYGIRPLKYAFNTYIDGVIAVSEFSLGYTTEIIKGKPSAVANPYIQPDLFYDLGEVSPNLTNKTAVTVGTFARYKGQDILVDAWQMVRQEHPSAHLKLVGSGYPQTLESTPGVEVLGYVEDLPSTLASASLYIQPSRMDNYPVSVLEALRVGLPALVTETTGNRDIIRQIDEDMIVGPVADELASGISRYFSLSTLHREKLSSIARDYGETFDDETQKKAFQSAFQYVVNNIKKF